MSRPRLALALLAIALYLSAAIRVGNVYPFAAFDMFAGRWEEASQVLAWPQGAAAPTPLGDWAWQDCDDVSRGASQLDATWRLPPCDPQAGHPEYEPRALARVRASTEAHGRVSATSVPVAVTRRTWRAARQSASGAATLDCVLLVCRASRRSTP